MPLFSRSVRTLIQRQRGEQLHIKVLQTLGGSALQDAIDIKVLQTLGMARDRPSPYGESGTQAWRGTGPRPTGGGRSFRCRSAGACPPRSLDLCGKRPQPRDPGCLSLRPTHGEGQALALRAMRRFLISYRSAGACPPRSLNRFCLRFRQPKSQSMPPLSSIHLQR